MHDACVRACLFVTLTRTHTSHWEILYLVSLIRRSCYGTLARLRIPSFFIIGHQYGETHSIIRLDWHLRSTFHYKDLDSLPTYISHHFWNFTWYITHTVSPGRIYCNYDVIMQCNFTCFLYSNLYYNITVHKTHSMRASDDVCIEASFNARFVYVLLLKVMYVRTYLYLQLFHIQWIRPSV